MKLEVIRFSSQKDSTNGLLMDVTNEIKFLCYTFPSSIAPSQIKPYPKMNIVNVAKKSVIAVLDLP